MSLEDRFAARMGALLGPGFPSDIALAVSGGGDSMAMLTLAHNWTRVWGVRLWVVTVDHGLRDCSADEAAMVAQTCADLGHPHATLRWHWDGTGNLQAEARAARLRLIDQWRHGIETVLMAHTADDVAETFLMRLARGSGVEGLSAMADSQWVRPFSHTKPALPEKDVTQDQPPPKPTRRVAGVPAFSNGFRVVRPLLQERRDDLRHYLRVLHGTWVEDPSNSDPRFDRVRWRRALPQLADLGLDTDRLAGTAQAMRRASRALEARAADVARRVVTPLPASGEVLLDRTTLAEVEEDTQLRILARALQWVAQAPYRPRLAPLEALLDRLLAGGGGTLHGCEARIYGDQIRLFREYAAVTDASAPLGAWWDNRFCVTGPKGSVRALGDEGWAQIAADQRQFPFHAARSLPAVFDGDRLLACPALTPLPGFRAEFIGKLPLFAQTTPGTPGSMRRRFGESD